MKVSFLAENLQKKIPFLNKIVSGKTQLPILLNFLIEAKGGKIKISATDLETGEAFETPAKVEEEGATTVPAKTFSELVANIPEGKITLETNQETLTLTSKNIKTTFQTSSPEDFPRLYEEGEEIARITKAQIEKDLGKVAFSASLDSERPALSGVLVKEEGEGIVMVATDGHRLSIKRGASLGTKKTLEKPLLISARTIRELVSMPAEGEISMAVSAKNNQVIFKDAETVLAGRLIDSEYPNYEKIIPTDRSLRAEFDKNEMQNAVKICSVFARETANTIKFSIKKESIIVSASTPPVGENTVEVAAKITGEENEIAFNSRYVLDFLSNADSEEIIFEMTGPLSPGVFKTKADKDFLHLIMPIRLVREA